MTRWLTSDTHFSHTNIIPLGSRPFSNIQEMNEVMIERWNGVVKPSDIVYHLGDVALGPIAESLPLVGRLNGFKILLVGNHDRIFKGNKQKQIDRFMPEYRKVFNSIWTMDGAIVIGGKPVMLSHFPYDSDSHDEDRYTSFRAVDRGLPILHGHTHSRDTVSYSTAGTKMIHVGVDSHGFVPVAEDEIVSLLED